MYEETKKEKDAMVMKYAMSEQKRWDSQKMLIGVNTRIGKPGRHFPVREFWTDWKSQGKSHKTLEKSANFRQMLLIIFNDI